MFNNFVALVIRTIKTSRFNLINAKLMIIPNQIAKHVSIGGRKQIPKLVVLDLSRAILVDVVD